MIKEVNEKLIRENMIDEVVFRDWEAWKGWGFGCRGEGEGSWRKIYGYGFGGVFRAARGRLSLFFFLGFRVNIRFLGTGVRASISEDFVSRIRFLLGFGAE